MSQQSGVIIQVASGGLWSGVPKALPTHVYVMTYGDGRVRALHGSPTAGDRWGSRYCYVVDTAEQRAHRSFSLPARGDAYSFTAELECTWKVSDPEAVVRAGLTDAEDVVLGRIKDELWQLGRRFPPDDAVGAENAARSALSRIAALDEGLSILRTNVRVSTDRRITSAVIAVDNQSHDDALAAHKLTSLKALLTGDDSLILLHLMKHPDDTRAVLDMIVSAKEQNESIRLGLLDRLLANGFIQDGDLDGLRANVLGTPQPSANLSFGSAPAAAITAPTSSTATSASSTSGGAHTQEEEDDDVVLPSTPDVNSHGGVKGWRPIGKPGQGS